MPVRVAEGSEVRPRHIVAHSAVAGLMMGMLVVWGALCALTTIFGDNLLNEEWWVLAVIVLGPLFFGALSAARFWSLFYRAREPRQWIRCVGRILLIAGVAELTLAVGPHVIVPSIQRAMTPYRITLLVTLCAILIGLAMLLMALGPEVFFIFADRHKHRLARRREDAEVEGGEA
jgi:hypothetical protein